MRVTVAVAIGLAFVSYHYARLPPLWHDEAALVLNVVGRDFRDFLGPLLYHEAAPPLFLVVERLVGLALGDGLYALRLPPYLASCAALLLFAWVARRRLSPSCAAVAVLLLACSDRFHWHASEAKPYAFDLLIAVAAPTLFLATEAWSLSRRILLFVFLTPPLLWLSFPACFVVGGLLVALLPAALLPAPLGGEGRTGGFPGMVLLYLAWAAAVGVSFLLLALGPVRAQRCAEMDSCWTALFPDWHHPWLVPVWAVRSTLGVLQYACPVIGLLLAVPMALGIASEWRRGERAWLHLLLTPVLLAFFASLIGKYPFGGARVLFFAAPAVLLLTGAGLERLGPSLAFRPRWLRVAVMALLLVPVGHAALRVVVPWKRAATDEAAAHVLARRGANEAVLCNCWEGFYLFRHVRPEVRSLHEPGTLTVPSPAWCVIIGAQEEQRTELLQLLQRDRTVLEQRDFRMATVLRLSAPRP